MKYKLLNFAILLLSLFLIVCNVLIQGENGLFDKYGVCFSSLQRSNKYKVLDYSEAQVAIGYDCRIVKKIHPSIEYWDMYAAFAFLILYCIGVACINLHALNSRIFSGAISEDPLIINFIYSVVMIAFMLVLLRPIYESLIKIIIVRSL